MPTASSTQINKKTMIAIRQSISRCCFVITLLNINSIKKPTENKRIPATIKSKTVQSTSLENCMAMSGTANIEKAITTINKSLFRFIFLIGSLIVIQQSRQFLEFQRRYPLKQFP